MATIEHPLDNLETQAHSQQSARNEVVARIAHLAQCQIVSASAAPVNVAHSLQQSNRLFFNDLAYRGASLLVCWHYVCCFCRLKRASRMKTLYKPRTFLGSSLLFIPLNSTSTSTATKLASIFIDYVPACALASTLFSTPDPAAITTTFPAATATARLERTKAGGGKLTGRQAH